MTLYAPVYNGKHDCIQIDHAEQLRFICPKRLYRYIENVGFVGIIWHEDTLFLTPETVCKYWNGEYIYLNKRAVFPKCSRFYAS